MMLHNGTAALRRRGGTMWMLYAGGFIGPFGGSMVTPLLPEFADDFGLSLSASGWSLTAYFVPFASLMLVSGSLAERWGRERTIRLGYVAYAAASLLCMVAPVWSMFIVGRIIAGFANSFTTPILIAAIADLAPPTERGRALGRYVAIQSAGTAFAPLIAGWAATVSWRWAFGFTVVLSLVLASLAMPAGVDGDQSGRPRAGRARALLNPRLAVTTLIAFLQHSSTLGAIVLTSLLVTDEFGLGPQGRGMVVAVFGVVGLFVGSRLGTIADRIGMARFGVMVSLVLGLGTASVGVMPSLALVVVAMGITGAASTGGRLVVGGLAVASTPANRGGATSVALAFQFLGGATAPILWIPVYESDPTIGLAAAGIGGVAAALFIGVAYLARLTEEADAVR